MHAFVFNIWTPPFLCKVIQEDSDCLESLVAAVLKSRLFSTKQFKSGPFQQTSMLPHSIILPSCFMLGTVCTWWFWYSTPLLHLIQKFCSNFTTLHSLCFLQVLWVTWVVTLTSFLWMQMPAAIFRSYV